MYKRSYKMLRCNILSIVNEYMKHKLHNDYSIKQYHYTVLNPQSHKRQRLITAAAAPLLRLR